MSARRARRSTRGRGRATSFADPVEEPISDPPPVISPDPPVPTSTTVPPNPQPAADIDMSTLVRGASVPSTEPTVVADDALSRQFLQLLQGAVRASGAMPDPPISQILIANGVRTFSGSLTGAPSDAETWLYDTERRMDQLGLEPAKRYLGAVSMLDGGAHIWWESVVSSVSSDRLTWDFFKERFKNRYLGDRYMRERRQAFRDLVQGTMTVLSMSFSF